MSINFKFEGAFFPNEEFALISIIDAEWQIEEYSSHFVFREAYSTDDIDFAFCGILNHFEGTLPKIEFARILGFSLIDIPEENIYRDEAEEVVLVELLKELELFGLIQIKVNEIKTTDSKKTKSQYLELTDEGRQSLNSKIKYRYWKGKMDCFKHYYNDENSNFDFLTQFGLKSTLPNKTNVPINELQSGIDNSFSFQLTGFQLNQASESRYELITNDIFRKKGNRNQPIQYALVQKTEKVNLLLVLSNNEVQEELTSIINNSKNEKYKDDLVHRCKFKALMNDITVIFDGKTVDYFLRLWNRGELIKDPRLLWSDNELWSVFNAQFNTSEWSLITKEAPIDILKLQISEFNNRFDWAILSERLDEEFVYEQLYTDGYRWDFEKLSSRESEFVWLLINDIANHNLNKENEQQVTPNWDFLLITDSLSDARIELLLPHKFSLDFIQLSKKEPEFVLSCLKEILKINSKLTEDEKPYNAIWDWKYISDNWSIATIWNNVELLEDNLNWHTFISRAFSNSQFTEIFLKGEQFKARLLKNKERIRPTFRLENLLWSEHLIDLFNETEILLWQSNNLQLGFECNPTIEWTPPLLRKYATHFTTQIGKNYISKSIKSWDFVFVVPDFEWNWNELCQNEYLNFDDFILNNFKNRLNWSILSKRIDERFIFEHVLDYDWDFGVLSAEKSDEFITNTLSQNNEILQKGWNWQHLTARLDKSFITANLVNINEKWDWVYLTREKFDKDEIIELWETTVQYWDWNYLLTKLFTVIELANDDFFVLVASCLNLIEDNEFRKAYWSVLTKRTTPEFLAKNDYEYLQFTMFEWDWSYLSQHPRFEFTIDFVQKFASKWDWAVLSQNRRINYDWTYLTTFNQFWNWSYISEFSTFIFTNRNLNKKTLNRFRRFIDFKAFSRRNDLAIDQQLINEYKNSDWDFAFLSSVKSIKPTQEFLREYAEKNWDWQKLSRRNDIKVEVKKNEDGKETQEKFINKLILEFQDRDWDWQYLSSRNDIEFSFEFIEVLANRNWDFKAISRNRQTVWTTELINFFQRNSIELDWDYISKNNEAIYKSPDRLEALKTYLNWDYLSVNQNIQVDENLLNQFAQNWNFKLLTKRKEIISKPEYFLKYKDKDWDWLHFTETFALQIDESVLSVLSGKIVWNELSRNENLQLTDKLITKFDGFWNFVELYKQQRRFTDVVQQALQPYFDEPKTRFLIRIDEQYSSWKGYVYHFTHLSNAVKIIKEMAIKSRYSANQINNSAGNVPDSSDKPKAYARFYFRPHTPAQFYNENLGKSPSDDYVKTWTYYDEQFSSHVRDYSKAATMGFPKCPVPIFFKINIKEILDKFYEKCFISNGNMQSNWANIFTIKEGLNHFDFDNLFMSFNPHNVELYKKASQQEFLVRDELSIFNLKSLEIICQSEEDKNVLINFIGNDHPFSDRIIIENYCDTYNYGNNRYKINVEENILSFNTSFSGVGKTLIKTNKIDCIKEIEGEIYKVKPYIIEAGKNAKIIFSDVVDFQVYFIDESNQEWLLYGTREFD